MITEFKSHQILVLLRHHNTMLMSLLNYCYLPTGLEETWNKGSLHGHMVCVY